MDGILEGRREEFLNICVPLYDASITADWNKVEAILNTRPDLVRYAINESYETPLHVAVSLNVDRYGLRTTFVQKLLQLMEPTDLEIQDKNYNTALCSVAISGNVKAAKLILKKNFNHPFELCSPLYLAATYGKRDMVRFLYDISRGRTDLDWTPQQWAKILVECIKYDMFDVALNIVTDVNELNVIFERDNPSNIYICRNLVYALARKTEAFTKRKEPMISKLVNLILCRKNIDVYSDALKILGYIWRNILRMKKKDIDMVLGYYRGDDESFRTLFVAAELGNTAFVVELVRGYRDLILKKNEDNRTIIHTAVLHGHERIYNLIHEIGGSMKNEILSLEDNSGNNMLHLFGLRLSDQMMTTRPMQIVEEYRWYKEVEMILPPDYREKRNKSDNKTPYQLFYKNSQQARSESLTWANYGLVVATLVLGVSFTATCSVPGGFDQDYGYPTLSNELSFVVFVFADTIAFMASVTSVLSFFSIVIFGHLLKDQMFYSLANTMFVGITTLLLSIVAFMVALGANLFIMLPNNSLRYALPAMFCTCLGFVVASLVDHFPLFKSTFVSKYNNRYGLKPHVRGYH